MGDVNGDGASDLGGLVFEESDDLDQTGKQLVHVVGHIYFGQDSEDDTPASELFKFAQPDLVFEPNNPPYFSEHALPDIELFRFGAIGSVDHVGDVNGDGNIDLAIADHFSGRSHIFFGQDLEVTGAAETVPVFSESELSDRFTFELATPSIADLALAPEGLDLSAIQSSDPLVGQTTRFTEIDNAFSLEGQANGEGIGVTRVIGDLNGDGLSDLLVSGNEAHYVILGPVDLDGLHRVTERADIIIPARIDFIGDDRLEQLRPADRMGDIDGDGLTDLLFFFTHESSTSVRFSMAN